MSLGKSPAMPIRVLLFSHLFIVYKLDFWYAASKPLDTVNSKRATPQRHFCADVTLVCGDNKKVYAHRFVLSSNSFEKKEIEKQYTNVTLAPKDGKYQPRNQKDRMYLFQSSGESQCAGGEFLEQNPVALPPWPTLQEGGIARHHKDQYSRGQVWGECYYERGGNHSNKKSEQFVRFVFVC